MTLKPAFWLLLVLAPQLWAQSPVWRVSNADSVLYIAGTVHMLRPADLPLPGVFDAAYRKADLLVFETDLAGLSDPAVQMQIAQGMSYPIGDTLSAHLSTQTWELLSQYARTRGLNPHILEPLRPSGVFLTLLGLEMVRLGATEEGVDMRLYRQASADGKPVRGLESLEQHLEYLLSMGEEDPDLFIGQMLDEIDSDDDMLGDLIVAWRQGDESALYDMLVQALQQQYAPLYQRLILDRNELWWTQVEALLASPDTELVLVGAAHLVGPQGLLDRLRASGAKVEALEEIHTAND